MVISRKSSTSSLRVPFSILNINRHWPPFWHGRAGGKSWSLRTKTALVTVSS